MKNKFTFNTFKAVQTLTFFVILFYISLEIKAQKVTKGEQPNVKSFNNVSTWVEKENVNKNVFTDNSFQNAKKNINGQVNAKQLYYDNPENYFHPEQGEIKLANSPESIEVIEKRDAQSRTFINTEVHIQ